MSSGKPLTHGALLVLVAVTLLGVGCRQDMHDAPYYEEFEVSEFFENGVVNQTPPEGTVARGLLKDDTHFWAGRDAFGQLVSTLPDDVVVSRGLLERGQERYEIFCGVCHDSSGSGRGMIVRRGFKQPQPLYEQRLRDQPIGYFYDVITNGFGVMPSYKVQVPVEDRWAITAYIRVLQVSQGQSLDDLPAEVQAEFQQALTAPPEPVDDGHGGHGGGHGDDSDGHS
ncbi:MAG: cytochrome c [Acidobacteriota bacterium]